VGYIMPKKGSSGAGRVRVSAAPPQVLPPSPVELESGYEEHRKAFFRDRAALACKHGLGDATTVAPVYGAFGDSGNWAQTKLDVADDGLLGISMDELMVRGEWAFMRYTQRLAPHFRADDDDRCFRGVVIAPPVLRKSARGVAEVLLADVDGRTVVLALPEAAGMKGKHVAVRTASIIMRGKSVCSFFGVHRRHNATHGSNSRCWAHAQSSACLSHFSPSCRAAQERLSALDARFPAGARVAVAPFRWYKPLAGTVRPVLGSLNEQLPTLEATAGVASPPGPLLPKRAAQ
jgi:hypothetical protein